jgi:hypothetical protein
MDAGTANIFATRAKPMINALDPRVRSRRDLVVRHAVAKVGKPPNSAKIDSCP